MPSVQIGSSNINTFSWTAAVNIQSRSITFDTSSTVYNGSGLANVIGISFSLVDSVGLELMGVNWTSPQIVPHVSQTYTLDLTSLPINFLFQNYQWIGYIKDADGTVYSTLPILKTVCEPPLINESGYVPGTFVILPDCINNIITVKELTVLVYNNQTPLSTSKSGTLTYPVGTISPVTFTNTPFSNNIVYTGQYRIDCSTVATYDLNDGITVLITYLTNQQFPVNCTNFLGDITCCLNKVYNTYITNCENSVGSYALQQYNATMLPFSLALAKQINGQDASEQVAQIKKMLNCDCGSTSVGQNEITPTNPAVTSIVLNGVGGTTIPAATITGNTKTFNIASNSYVVAKGDTGDLAYTITIDTSVSNVVTYKITFNYDTMAGYILTAIQNNPTLINILNSLITATGANITGLDGKCVIDLTHANYAVSQSVNSSTLITNIVINGTNYAAPSNLFANDVTSVANWLNSLSLGTFTAVLNSGTLTIQSVNNTHTLSTITFTTPDIVKMFSATNATLVQVLQAMINWMCNQTALQVALANTLTLCTFDYNGNVVSTDYVAGTSQQVFDAGIASSICTIVARMNSITGVTCAALQAIFIDRPSLSFGASDRMYGTLGGLCAGLTDQQFANAVIAAVGKYSDVKAAWCAIDCTVPGTCPDVSNISLASVGANIGFYGLTWASTTAATQTVTIKYRLTGTSVWTIATNTLLILPNGTISGTTPFQISGLSTGTQYDVFVMNNCGGVGKLTTFTTPTGSVYSGSYLLDNIIYNICGETPVTLYSSLPFASGVIMYSDIGLTTPVTGYTYITKNGSNIFELNTSTGVVGIDTGTACTTGTAGVFTLGNDLGTICAGSPVTLYTNGAFTVGSTLYTDAALTTPQTGYSYALSNANNHIYAVNSGTGAVTSDTGNLCTGTATLTFSFVNAGGSFLNFQASLNRAVDANISIDRVFADGFPNPSCTGGTSNASAQKNTSMVIVAGGTGVGATPDATSGTWASATHYSMYNVIINGVSYLNGDVVAIGTYNCTIVIPSCN